MIWIVLLAVIPMAWGQSCQCSIFQVRSRDANGIPVDKSSELWRLTETPAGGCAAAEVINCENNCIQTFRNWKANNTMYSIAPGTNGRDYGSYFCMSTGSVVPPGYPLEALHQIVSCYDWISSTEVDNRQNLCCNGDTWNFWDCPYNEPTTAAPFDV
ncbi:unnamed protein product [Owenia fusiformis]|uniref:Uncharacterized protein n=1 Tax=Owenia fusiformis TaxID=6347 RepID=A0A8J1XH24_OWEFU|nr:unnamed protein product [Owenia fusiformis]